MIRATEKLTNCLSATYRVAGNDPAEQQMKDCLFITEKKFAFFPGNAPALPAPESQDKEIGTFVSDLRRVITHQMNKADGNIPPS